MSLLRNTDDNSINFQKASFTLDGCVKIWTSRVDSVGTETGKLLSNLAQEHGREQEDEEGAGEAGVEEEGSKKKQKVAAVNIAKFMLVIIPLVSGPPDRSYPRQVLRAATG